MPLEWFARSIRWVCCLSKHCWGKLPTCVQKWHEHQEQINIQGKKNIYTDFKTRIIQIELNAPPQSWSYLGRGKVGRPVTSTVSFGERDHWSCRTCFSHTGIAELGSIILLKDDWYRFSHWGLRSWQLSGFWWWFWDGTKSPTPHRLWRAIIWETQSQAWSTGSRNIIQTHFT